MRANLRETNLHWTNLCGADLRGANLFRSYLIDADLSDTNLDNGFFEDTLREVVEGMRERQYEPVGISLNPPFECTSADNSIAFVMRINDEIYWVHMPETYWFHLLADDCGREHADMIISEVN